eukprot:gene29832-29960_t
MPECLKTEVSNLLWELEATGEVGCPIERCRSHALLGQFPAMAGFRKRTKRLAPLREADYGQTSCYDRVHRYFPHALTQQQAAELEGLGSAHEGPSHGEWDDGFDTQSWVHAVHDTTDVPAPDAGLWRCECGFWNKAEYHNTLCGGRGVGIGCKRPRPRPGSGAAVACGTAAAPAELRVDASDGGAYGCGHCLKVAFIPGITELPCPDCNQPVPIGPAPAPHPNGATGTGGGNSEAAGGEEQWPRLPAAAGVEERRVDPTDGKAYTRAEFVAEYGGSTEWDAATRPEPRRLMPALPARRDRDRDGEKGARKDGGADGPHGGMLLYPSVAGIVASAADSAWYRAVQAKANHVPGGRPLLILLFIDGTSKGRIGNKVVCPGYVAVVNAVGGLTEGGWHFFGLFPCGDRYAVKRKRPTFDTLRSLVACKQESTTHRMITWLHEFGLGYDHVLFDMFHVIGGLAALLLEWILKAAKRTKPDAARADAHQLQTLMQLLPIALIGLAPLISRDMRMAVFWFVCFTQAYWRPEHQLSDFDHGRGFHFLRRRLIESWAVWRTVSPDGKPFSRSLLCHIKFHVLVTHLVSDIRAFGPRVTAREAEKHHGMTKNAILAGNRRDDELIVFRAEIRRWYNKLYHQAAARVEAGLKADPTCITHLRPSGVRLPLHVGTAVQVTTIP